MLGPSNSGSNLAIRETWLGSNPTYNTVDGFILGIISDRASSYDEGDRDPRSKTSEDPGIDFNSIYEAVDNYREKTEKEKKLQPNKRIVEKILDRYVKKGILEKRGNRYYLTSLGEVIAEGGPSTGSDDDIFSFGRDKKSRKDTPESLDFGLSGV